MHTSKDILKKYWHFDTFQYPQEEIIEYLIHTRQDALVLMPTGAGKSLCFQIPALLLEGVCVVVSPLIALMQNQVLELKNKGVPCAAIYTGMQNVEIKNILKLAQSGNIKLLYLSPERLQTPLLQEWLLGATVSLIAIDEAHCISQWGHDFRAAYLQIHVVREVLPKVPMLALTASATKQVRQDIIDHLHLHSVRIFTQSYQRAKLSYSAFECADKAFKLRDILTKVKGSALVYCATRKQCESVSRILVASGLSADYYHAGITTELRMTKQQHWIQNKVRIMVCTNAFGMGIHKPDVRMVLHYEAPSSIEHYYQEAGRAGRDHQKAFAVLLYHPSDFDTLYQKLAYKHPPLQVIQQVYDSLHNYYRIALGKGAQTMFDYEVENILPLVTNIETKMLVGAMHTLSYAGVLSIIENPKIPAKVSIACNRNYFTEFQQKVPALSSLMEYLVRQVPHLWHDTCVVQIEQVARSLKIEKNEVHRRLKILDSAQIIHYFEPIKQSQIVFLHPRTKDIRTLLDLKAQQVRKQIEEKQTKRYENFCLAQSTHV